MESQFHSQWSLTNSTVHADTLPEAWKQKLSSGPCLEGTLVLTFEPGCVGLFAILGISVKQIMKLESEDKVSSFPLPAPPSLCWPRATPPAGQRARWELPGENGPQQPSPEQEWGVESTQVPERDSSEFQRASGLGWRLLERKSRKWGAGEGQGLGRQRTMEDGSPQGDTHRTNYPAGKRTQELPRPASPPRLRVPGLGQLTCNSGSGPGIVPAFHACLPFESQEQGGWPS